MKYFIITVDTEGDNGWSYHEGDEVSTENVLSLPRFQELCEKYGFMPVYLTNYEVICDNRFVTYFKPKAEAGLCEIGIHVHAWNNPPLYPLDRKYDGNPYLIEYPYNVMEAKFSLTYNLIKDKIGIAPASHRAGRWVMNDDYFKLLEEYNVLVDCSVTPGLSWDSSPGATVAGGADYSHEKNYAKPFGHVLEVPVTIKKMRCGGDTIKRKIKNLLKERRVWLRPAVSSLQEMKRVVNSSKNDFVEFMIHSSELMPGCSPYFEDVEAIERLYADMEQLFQFVKEHGYEGITLKDYRDEHQSIIN